MNVLMLYLDCLRLDRVPLMERTLRMVRQPGWFTFTNHRSVAQCSDPNFLTILTGGTSDDHRVYTQMGGRFQKEFNTLPKRLKRAGYHTWSYQPVAVPKFYTSGYDDIIYHQTHEVSPVMAPGIKRILRESASEPWFGFLRVMDTHYPYNGEPLPEDREGIPAQYDRSVWHSDRFVSHLISWVLKHYPNTMVVLGSDHGEMLGDYGGLWDHLFSLKDRLTRVPLFVHWPGQAGGVVKSRTQHPVATGFALAAAQLADPPKLEGDRPTWLACWGTASRDEWKHRALVLTDDDGNEWKYTINWTTINDEVGCELHLNGDEDVNYFGRAAVGVEMAGLMEQEYPTTPKVTKGREHAHTARPENVRGAPGEPADGIPLGGA